MRIVKWIMVLLIVLMGLSFYAFAAANTVPTTGASNQTQAVSANTLKPAECASLSLQVTLTGSGTINGSGSDELILGSSIVDNISAGAGNDCVISGDGNDTLTGGNGTDILLAGNGTDIVAGSAGNDVLYGNEGDDDLQGGNNDDVLYGGGGNDTLNGGSGIDVCYGGAGTNSFQSCETTFNP